MFITSDRQPQSVLILSSRFQQAEKFNAIRPMEGLLRLSRVSTLFNDTYGLGAIDRSTRVAMKRLSTESDWIPSEIPTTVKEDNHAGLRGRQVFQMPKSD
jgi:hypothetical protein